MKHLLPLLALALASPAAVAGCTGAAPPPTHGGDSRDAHGLAWYSQPVCYRAEFVPGGLTLDADAREALAQRLEGARRLFRTDCITLTHGPEQADREAARVAYLRWWLGLQGVTLHDATLPDRFPPPNGGDVIELQFSPCRR